jgi:ferric-chelate reductase [NAD(P)H]
MEAELDPKSLWSISYGLYVVTSAYEGKSNGQIANAVIQVAAEPPRVLAALNKKNFTHELVEKSNAFAVSVLGEDVPMQFIGGFGFKSGRETDKLSAVEAEEGSTGIPCVTEHAIAMFEVKVFATADAGTHTIFIGDVVSGKVLKADGKPLTYAQYQANKGKAPRNAPTYRAPE